MSDKGAERGKRWRILGLRQEARRPRPLQVGDSPSQRPQGNRDLVGTPDDPAKDAGRLDPTSTAAMEHLEALADDLDRQESTTLGKESGCG